MIRVHYSNPECLLGRSHWDGGGVYFVSKKFFICAIPSSGIRLIPPIPPFKSTMVFLNFFVIACKLNILLFIQKIVFYLPRLIFGDLFKSLVNAFFVFLHDYLLLFTKRLHFGIILFHQVMLWAKDDWKNFHLFYFTFDYIFSTIHYTFDDLIFTTFFPSPFRNPNNVFKMSRHFR